MYGKALLLFSAINYCLGQSINSPALDWIQTDDTGAYRFGYATGDEGRHYHLSSATADNTVAGRFGYKDPATGRDQQTTYTAGRRGFRARGPHIARRMDLSQDKPPFSRPNDDGQYHPELDNIFDPNEDRGYDFSYRTPDHIKEEHANRVGDVQGRYSYLDDIGFRHNVDYIAGSKTGFVVTNPVPDTFAQARGGPLYFVGKTGGSKVRGFSAVQKNLNGAYRFLASGPDHKRSEISDASGNRRGVYTYLDDKGVQHTVEYIAGPKIGYKVINNKKGVNHNPILPFFPDSSTIQPLFPSAAEGSGLKKPLGLLPTIPPPSSTGGSGDSFSSFGGGSFPSSSSSSSEGGSSFPPVSPAGGGGSFPTLPSGGSGSFSTLPSGGSGSFPASSSSGSGSFPVLPSDGSGSFPSLPPSSGGTSSSLGTGSSSGTSKPSTGRPSLFEPSKPPNLFKPAKEPSSSHGLSGKQPSPFENEDKFPSVFTGYPSTTPFPIPAKPPRPGVPGSLDPKWNYDFDYFFNDPANANKDWSIKGRPDSGNKGGTTSTSRPSTLEPFPDYPAPFPDPAFLLPESFGEGLNTAESGNGVKPSFGSQNKNDCNDTKGYNDKHKGGYDERDQQNSGNRYHEKEMGNVPFTGSGGKPMKESGAHHYYKEEKALRYPSRGTVKFGGAKKDEWHKIKSEDGYFSIPPGVAVRAHVQSLDIVPYNKRFLSPGEALEHHETSNKKREDN